MKGSLSVVVVFICVIVMVIFGGLALSGIAGSVAGDDVAGTPFEGVASMVADLYSAISSAFPLVVWLLVIGVVVFSLFALMRFRK